jgi:hypothetical protein
VIPLRSDGGDTVTGACKQLILCSGLIWALGSHGAGAQHRVVLLNLAIEPQLFHSEFVTSKFEQVKEARFRSGLGVSLSSPLFQLKLGYKLQSRLKAEAARPGDGLSQHFKAGLISSRLNQLLGIQAGVRTDSLLREGGDAYRYQVTPGISRSLSKLARLRLNYEYVVDKPARQKLKKQKRGYAMVLDGSLQSGRLTWRGSYRSDDERQDRLILSRSTEVLDLKSSYRMSPTLQLELSGAFKQQTRFKASAKTEFIEQRYGAAMAWSPSRQYALALKVNTLDDERANRRDTFGSGSISWVPRRNLQFTLGYGDKLVEGAPGWMLETRFDLDG